MSALRLAPGTILSGRYLVGEVIGESDLSTVYSATDQRGPAPVALKVFEPAVKARAAALSEYQAQARQASGLGVEGIARAYDFGIDANSGAPFSTAERIGWASLDRRVLAQGPLGVADLARAMGVLARALDAAHATGLLHRDLKPQNVFISPENPEWSRITDFGASAVRRGAPEAMGWGGPPGYTPPDAVDASAPSSPGADLFALGVVAFFALTRGTPFRSLRSPTFDPNSHWSELNQPLSPVSERAKEIGVALDPALDPWFARALALSPQERFRSAGELARELATVAQQLSARGGGGPRSMPGIAAAIAQPLVFQPEPSPASLGLAPTSPITTAAMAAVAAAPAPGSPASAQARISSADESVAPANKKSLALPLMIGLGVLLLSGLAIAGYAVLGKRQEPVAAAPSAAPSANVASAGLPAPLPAASVAASPAKARITCQPEACESVVCDGKPIAQAADKADVEVEVEPGAHACSASKSGFTSQPVAFTATAGQTSAVQFELTRVPPSQPAKAAPAAQTQSKPAAVAATAKPAAAAPSSKAATAAKASTAASAKPAAATSAKTAATAAASAKAAASATAAKAAAASKTKKKCSTFLGCK